MKPIIRRSSAQFADDLVRWKRKACRIKLEYQKATTQAEADELIRQLNEVESHIARIEGVI